MILCNRCGAEGKIPIDYITAYTLESPMVDYKIWDRQIHLCYPCMYSLFSLVKEYLSLKAKKKFKSPVVSC